MIRQGERCYLDSNTLIAIFERASPMLAAQRDFLLAVRDGILWCATSELALAECLVKPLRDNNEVLLGCMSTSSTTNCPLNRSRSTGSC